MMKIIEPYEKLLDILCGILIIDNNLALTIDPFERTKFNKSQNAINIRVDKGIGIINLFRDLGHEVFHVKQHGDKTINYDMQEYHSRIHMYEKDEWMMYYFYNFEREAQSFAWILTGFIIDFFYENSERQDVYQNNKKLYSTMMKVIVSDVKLTDQKEETQVLLDECYNRFNELYKDAIIAKKNDLIDWYKKYISPRSA